MKIIKAGYEIITPVSREAALQRIEDAARTCYKSEDKVTEISASALVKSLIKHGHEAMIEHYSISVKFICDRGVSHEIVRHRIASYAQESTRYCNYSKDKFGNEITVVQPCFWIETDENYAVWVSSMLQAENSYFALINNGATPEQARSVLPHSLKTEIVMTANIREWRQFFKLRTTRNAHPQIREIATPLFNELKEKLPELFEDIETGEA